MRRRVLLGLGCLVILGAIAAAVVVLRGSGEKSVAPPPAPPPPPPPTLERVEDLAARVPAGRHVVLRSRPDGRALATVASRTEFGSPQTLAVAFRKGDWIAVRSPKLGNRRLGWVRAKPLRLLRRPADLVVDLSQRQLTVHGAHGVERRISVAVGAPDTPTPIGRFYVDQRIITTNPNGPYGPAALGVSAFSNVLTGWVQGGPIAIHGTNEPWSIGHAVSNGCIRLPNPTLTRLFRVAVAGTPVIIHP